MKYDKNVILNIELEQQTSRETFDFFDKGLLFLKRYNRTKKQVHLFSKICSPWLPE